jgi:uncharacterized protein (DUF1800 family)
MEQSRDARQKGAQMPDQLITRMAWCLRNYKNAAKQGRVVSTDVEATAEVALREYDLGLQQDAEDRDDVERRITDPKVRSW